jgi:hypothetical protein
MLSGDGKGRCRTLEETRTNEENEENEVGRGWEKDDELSFDCLKKVDEENEVGRKGWEKRTDL